jgi:hypothetical protein
LCQATCQCQDIPGYELFQYVDAEGMHHSIDSADVNDSALFSMGPLKRGRAESWPQICSRSPQIFCVHDGARYCRRNPLQWPRRQQCGQIDFSNRNRMVWW